MATSVAGVEQPDPRDVVGLLRDLKEPVAEIVARNSALRSTLKAQSELAEWLGISNSSSEPGLGSDRKTVAEVIQMERHDAVGLLQVLTECTDEIVIENGVLLSKLKANSDDAARRLGISNGSSGPGLGSDQKTVYVGSVNRHKFHLQRCKWMRSVPDYLLVKYPSRDAARNDGRRPCRTCGA